MRRSAAHLFVTLLSLAGTALPVQSDTPPPSEPKASATQPAQETKSSLDKAIEKEAKSYRVREKDGKPLYCRTETELGSRLAKMICLSRAQLVDRVITAQQTNETLTRSSSQQSSGRQTPQPPVMPCGTPAGCN